MPRQGRKHGKVFTGFGPAASKTAIARMSRAAASWRLHRKVSLSWADLARQIGPVISGWMNYYGRYHRPELYPLLCRINHYLMKWMRAKYKRLRSYKALWRAWDRVTTQYPGSFPHWQWETSAWW